MTAGARLSGLLGHGLIARLERLRVRAVGGRTARGRGEHLAGRGGASTDFVDYREYVAGDDLRYVDWNIFARLQKPFLKQFRREEERHLVIVVDASRSMAAEGKDARAKQLAAAFAVAGIAGGDKVSMWCTAAPGPADAAGAALRLPPCQGRPFLRRALAAAEGIGPGAGSATFDRVVERAMGRHTGRGIAILISDFLGGDLRRLLSRIAANGLEPHALQVLSPTELDPALSGDLRLVDSETGDLVDVSDIGDLLHLYHAQREALQEAVAQGCTVRQGRAIVADSGADLEEFLLGTLRRRGWLA
jgi:uncharacterized protein (DUF58 family)